MDAAAKKLGMAELQRRAAERQRKQRFAEKMAMVDSFNAKVVYASEATGTLLVGVPGTDGYVDFTAQSVFNLRDFLRHQYKAA